MTISLNLQHKNNRFKHTALATALCLVTGTASAVGLSNLELHSGLHQPFSASIPLRNFDPVEADRISVEIANDAMQSQYDSTGYLPAPVLATLDTTEKGTVIRLTSPQAIDEPFMKFAVQLNSPQGLILRQYEVLLDPPNKIQQAPVAAALTVAPTAPAIASTPEHVHAGPRIKPSDVDALEQAILLSEVKRTQALELATAPTTAALKMAPAAEVEIDDQLVTLEQVSQALAAVNVETVVEASAPATGALTSAPAMQEAKESKLYNSAEISEENLAAVKTQFSVESIYGAESNLSQEASLGDEEAIPQTGALTEAPTTAKAHSAISSAIPKGVLMGAGSARFDVPSSAFDGQSADQVARALIAYRALARSGAKPDFNASELMQHSAGAVIRTAD